MKRSIVSAAGLAAVCLGVGSCRQDLDGAWVGSRLGGWVDFHEDGKTSAQDVWRGKGIRLTLKDFALEDEAHDFARRNKLVMVTFPFASELGRQLATDPLTLFYDAGNAERPGSAAVALVDPMVRNGLAAAAHGANDHACGNLVPLALTTVVDDVRITPPLYAEGIELAGVKAVLGEPKATNIDSTIRALEAMGTRFHDSDSGRAATAKIEQMFSSAAGGKIQGLTIEQVSHVETQQKSLVVTIPGTEDDGSVVILGAHLDSINGADPEGPAPGADDDASGVATLVETLRVIADKGMTFRRKVELHAYAGEEAGLIGSSEIASSYDAAGRTVQAMFQVDMNSWASVPGSDTIFVVKTDTSMTLRRATKDLLNTYLGGNYYEKTLGGGTSDHKSWSSIGYPAVFNFEDPENYNHALHKPADNSETINSLELSERFVKLALAFVSHQAGLASAAGAYDTALSSFKGKHAKDLKLAIAPSGSDGFYSVSVAASDQIKTVELCKIEAAGGVSCTKERLGALSVKAAGGRTFYAADQSLVIEDGMRFAVYGYDENDKLIDQRSVQFKKKK